jgi:Na+/proline symporter
VDGLLWLPIALGLLLLYPAPPGLSGGALVAEREATYVLGIVELLPPGVKGLLLTAMLAALASTLDTHLNWGAAYWTNDIYARFIAPRSGRAPQARTLVRVARGSNLLLLALAFAVMTQLASIRAAWEASLLLGAGVGVVLVLRWIWWRLNAWGEVGALAASALLVPATLAFVAEENALARRLQCRLCAEQRWNHWALRRYPATTPAAPCSSACAPRLPRTAPIPSARGSRRSRPTTISTAAGSRRRANWPTR